MRKYQTTIDQIKKYIDFQDVFGATHIRCINPNHADNRPSAYVYPDHIYCFSCGMVERDIIKAYMQHKNVRHSSAVRQIWHVLSMKGARTYREEQQIVTPVPESQIIEWIVTLKTLAPKRVFLRTNYALSPKVISESRLGYTGIAFSIPHMGADGAVYNVKFRIDPELYSSGQKYWSLKHRKFTHPYPGYKYAEYYQNPPERLALTEGEFDTLSNLSHDMPSLAIIGSSTKPEKFSDLWERLREADTTIYLAFDNDPAGCKASRRYAKYFDHFGIDCKRAKFSTKDIAEFWRLRDNNA